MIKRLVASALTLPLMAPLCAMAQGSTRPLHRDRFAQPKNVQVIAKR